MLLILNGSLSFSSLREGLFCNISTEPQQQSLSFNLQHKFLVLFLHYFCIFMYLFLLVVCGMILFQNIISKEEQFCILGFIPQDTMYYFIKFCFRLLIQLLLYLRNYYRWCGCSALKLDSSHCSSTLTSVYHCFTGNSVWQS